MNPLLRKTTMLVIAATVAISAGKFTYVRAQGSQPPAPLKGAIPLRPLAALSTVPTPTVPGIAEYVVNRTAVVALGKALFWDMQVGSDGVQACATCHFNAGADSRAVNQVSPGLKGDDNTFQIGVQVGNNYGPNYALHAGNATAGFGGYHDGDFPLHKQNNVDTRNSPGADVNDVISSQGVYSSSFDKITRRRATERTNITTDLVFSFPDPADATKKINTRRVEPRNTPTVVNALFNHRNFWDGRARNVCNGANPFGDRDTTSHFFKADSTTATPKAVLVRLENSALCSQALGPPLSSFEMSADGRNFKQLGRKLLSVNPLKTGPLSKVLGIQVVHFDDSVLGVHSRGASKGLKEGYADMIRAAFAPRWWRSQWRICLPQSAAQTETLLAPGSNKSCPAGTDKYSQMEYNFSIFWGIAIQMYESTLRADKTPMDQYLAQQTEYTLTGDNTQNSFTLALNAGITPYTVSVTALNPALDASDQEVFAFDNGNGQIEGPGITSGSVDYASGTVNLFFDLPPTTAFPVSVKYSVGATPLTDAQLHGLQVFQTKGRCVACHGGPELSNASVANVTAAPLERMTMGDFNVRVYDDGFYNIGVRRASEDLGLGGVDGITGLPLSEALNTQKQVCAGTINGPVIPGRPGDGLTAAPLSCDELIGMNGNMKTPMLRNIALTAPYFHNGGQLTLEQVVEFYNRGGDFPDGFDQIPLIDPNIVPLGLTENEKTDLVDFLRNGLTDARTVNQQAPFEHPSIFVPNGHPYAADGYPVVNDPAHLGQATPQYLTIPAVGRKGGKAPASFLENTVKP